MNLICFDLGTKHIGVAANNNSRNAFRRPMIEIKNNNNDVKNIFEAVEKYILMQNNIDTIVIGYPKTSGANTWVKTVENVFNLLKKRFNSIKFVLFDERFSTHFAINNLKINKFKQKEIKETKDSESARVILENYIATI